MFGDTRLRRLLAASPFSFRGANSLAAQAPLTGRFSSEVYLTTMISGTKTETKDGLTWTYYLISANLKMT